MKLNLEVLVRRDSQCRSLEHRGMEVQTSVNVRLSFIVCAWHIGFLFLSSLIKHFLI